MNYDTLYAFVLAASVLAISPGPDNIYVLMQSMINGKKYGLATAVGLTIGCLVHTTFVALGVSALIKQSDFLFLVIKVSGALYLFFLAYLVWRSNAIIEISQTNIKKSSFKELFKQGFIMNVLNPKVSIFFLAFFPSFLFSYELSNVTQFYVLGLLFMAVSFFAFSLIAILAGYISKAIKGNTRIGYFFKWIQIIVFVGIGLYLLLN